MVATNLPPAARAQHEKPAHLAMDQDAGLPLVLAVAAADAHEAAGALPAAEAPPRHLCTLALQRVLHLSAASG